MEGPSSTTADRLRRRHDALWAIRSLLVSRGFVEVDTPLLTPAPGLEPHLDPIRVDVRLDLEPASVPHARWLVTSPELAMKRLLGEPGVGRIFQLSHVFRDGERTRRHLPEFTLLEWYRARETLDALVADHEDLFRVVASAVGVDAPKTPFLRATLRDLFEEHAGVDLDAALDAGDLVDVVRAKGEPLRAGADFEDAFFHVMATFVEPNIGRDRPIVVQRWPASMAALARTCDDDPRYAWRFEVYAGGLEISNAFDELTDAVEQRRRFVDDNAKRAALGKPALPIDDVFLEALVRMPPTAGCALGVDRLLMYLLGTNQIDDVTALRWR